MVKAASESASGAVPESVIDSVNETLSNLQELKQHFQQFMPLFSDPQVLSQMPPLHRAHSFFLLSQITSNLLALNLRCSGVHPDDHPIKSELDRVNLYQDKLERLLDLMQAPLRPSTTLNYQAATRFIEHSLPDLTQEQRQNMRSISRGERRQGCAGQKRKYQSSEKQSVQNATKEFLEKAALELFGNNPDSIKGPLRFDMSDDDSHDDDDNDNEQTVA
ncbi:hypothetical protein HN51_059529 [Arachis hypogaea]|uniref:Nuclear nucleic acid-binding protein C1D n=1 Tax=Arachis hypogaea TaxID=3818 RepID=A0A444X611_ARAHY|nr:nuclear nucleic acid-binding protein C1D [Arachis ipaensis]XP_025681500.1 nuclear nucleic acid-binding protein C1D [Arachis hypogaea]XP_029152162.1 nuclear nucleic acid-binding protein C1D [Arachis hypogaea]QHN82953.1 Nuclear nucleic acid-binding proteinD [Arachis hypogaea]RYQ85108.1 hypothetical protein Ahy_B10g104622 [Arachis hypogaea]